MRTTNFLARTTSLSSLAALLLMTPLLGGARGCAGDDVPIGAHDAGGPADSGPASDAGPGPRSCGGNTLDPVMATCPTGYYCAYTPEAMCGAADAPGVCMATPEACASIFAPVCGCDGSTYDNECTAALAGTGVLRAGACDTVTPECALAECGPPLGAPTIMCSDGSIGGSTGRCLRDPSTGTCGWELRDCPPDRACGGHAPPGVDTTCPMGSYCHYTPDAICGAADATGTCALVPDACTRELAPVCGCDGVTYGNECMAAVAHTSAAHTGECDTCLGYRVTDSCVGDTAFAQCQTMVATCAGGVAILESCPLQFACL